MIVSRSNNALGLWVNADPFQAVNKQYAGLPTHCTQITRRALFIACNNLAAVSLDLNIVTMILIVGGVGMESTLTFGSHCPVVQAFCLFYPHIFCRLISVAYFHRDQLSLYVNVCLRHITAALTNFHFHYNVHWWLLTNLQIYINNVNPLCMARQRGSLHKSITSGLYFDDGICNWLFTAFILQNV